MPSFLRTTREVGHRLVPIAQADFVPCQVSGVLGFTLASLLLHAPYHRTMAAVPALFAVPSGCVYWSVFTLSGTTLSYHCLLVFQVYINDILPL